MNTNQSPKSHDAAVSHNKALTFQLQTLYQEHFSVRPRNDIIFVL